MVLTRSRRPPWDPQVDSLAKIRQVHASGAHFGMDIQVSIAPGLMPLLLERPVLLECQAEKKEREIIDEKGQRQLSTVAVHAAEVAEEDDE